VCLCVCVCIYIYIYIYRSHTGIARNRAAIQFTHTCMHVHTLAHSLSPALSLSDCDRMHSSHRTTHTYMYIHTHMYMHTHTPTLARSLSDRDRTLSKPPYNLRIYVHTCTLTLPHTPARSLSQTGTARFRAAIQLSTPVLQTGRLAGKLQSRHQGARVLPRTRRFQRASAAAARQVCLIFLRDTLCGVC